MRQIQATVKWHVLCCREQRSSSRAYTQFREHLDADSRISRVKATLTTTGRKSGKPRSVPLYAWPDADNLVIVGSWAGRPKNPDWVENLRAEPKATIRVGKEDRQVHAREVKVPSKERDRLWKLVTEAFRYYETYQRKTDRVIPLFVLEPDGRG
jgi:deazaflavin-dependent oxidoreductase (nitroreductase family)